MKKSFRDILAGVESDMKSRVAAKLPGWDGLDLEYPSRLSLEQCSSSAAAERKAEVAGELFGTGFRLADLTGGLGSDAYAFSKIASRVWYNERNAELSAAAERNFRKLGAERIEVHTFDIGTDDQGWEDSLRAFSPDVVYLDPARRDGSGKKVFLLEDCSPDIVSLAPLLLDIAPHVIVKLSPMADITMVCRRLGGHVSELRVVGLDGECKELLCVLGRETCADPVICVDEIAVGEMRFSAAAEESSELRCPTCQEEIKGFLYEPSAALQKSGARKLLCGKYGLKKLGSDINLYISEQRVECGFFKTFRIVEIFGLDREGCRKVSLMFPKSDVTAKGLPFSSETLTGMLKMRSGSGEWHVFGVATHFGEKKRLLIVCKRVPDLSNFSNIYTNQ